MRVVTPDAALALLATPPRDAGRVLRDGISDAAAARMLSLSAAAERLDEAAEERRAAAAWVRASANCETALSICAVAASERPPRVRPRDSHRCVKDMDDRDPGVVDAVDAVDTVDAIASAALDRLAGSSATF